MFHLTIVPPSVCLMDTIITNSISIICTCNSIGECVSASFIVNKTLEVFTTAVSCPHEVNNSLR